MTETNPQPEATKPELTREDAIDFLFMMSAKAAAHPINKNRPPEMLFHATCDALQLIGVTEDEIGSWGVRNIRKALGITES